MAAKRKPVAELLEGLASEVMFAEASDGAAVGRLQALFRELAASAKDAGQAGLADEAARGAELLKPPAKGKAADVARALTEVGELVARLQQEQRRGGAGAGQAAAAPARTAAGDELVLPEWSDENVLREFLSAQEGVLSELEGSLLAEEGGKAEQREEFRRKLHTLKGEAGTLGLTDLEQVCHALEDFFVAGECGGGRADTVLRVLDWMGEAVKGYSRMKLPVPRGGQMVAEMAAGTAAAKAEGAEASAPAKGQAGSAAPAKAQEQPGTAEPASPKAAPAPPPAQPAAEAPTELSRDEETVILIGEFLNEAEEGLSSADQILMNVERDGADPEKINGLFRVFHTIKGVAGSLDLVHMSGLAHTTETMLNRCRQGELQLGNGILDLVFDSTALMRAMLQDVRQALEEGTPLAAPAALAPLRDRIKAATEGSPPPAAQVPDVRPGASLGEILTQAPFHVPAEAVAQAVAEQKETGRRIGEQLAASGAADPRQVAQALRAQTKAATAGEGAVRLRETVKVDLERVDNLVEMIGELVIVESMVVNAPEIEAIPSTRVRNYLGQLAKVTRDLQDVGMRMRMVPLSGVFQKMARMVRDLSHKSGKRVQLLLSGETAEMDRGMVEQLADPLVHMIRNSMDHGLEGAEERTKAGKSPTGTIRLSAFHEGGSIVIEVADDGRGLDREAILKKALSQGLVQEGASLTDAEINALIFAPGFSTAKQVTEISGRGVGMDVVRRNIETMRGRVQISTVPGAGTTFRIVLPLTLAIIDGMLVRCGSERYIIPTLSIIESIQPDRSMLVTLAQSTEMINVRGEILPLLRLDRLFRLSGARQDPTEGLVVLLEGMGRKLGLLVDEVVTQQQVVIKSMGAGIDDAPLVSGAAILADGRVGLILNTELAAQVAGRKHGALREAVARAKPGSTQTPLQAAA